MNKGLPQLPQMRDNYTPAPIEIKEENPTGKAAESDSLGTDKSSNGKKADKTGKRNDAKKRDLEAFIRGGSSKPGDTQPEELKEKKIGLILSGEQMKMIKDLQKLAPKNVGKQKSFSIQDFANRAVDLLLKKECAEYGIPFLERKG